MLNLLLGVFHNRHAASPYIDADLDYGNELSKKKTFRQIVQESNLQVLIDSKCTNQSITFITFNF